MAGRCGEAKEPKLAVEAWLLKRSPPIKQVSVSNDGEVLSLA
jgi:hypothetical protein